MPKKPKSERALFIPSQQTKWLPYVEEGFEDDPIQVEVLIRRNLTMDELASLEIPDVEEGLTGAELQTAVAARNEEIYDALAPFVLDWNLGYLTPSGEQVKADPPAVAGGGQFPRFLGPRVTGRIFWDVKLRNTGLVKAKSSTPPVAGADMSGDSNSTPTETEEE